MSVQFFNTLIGKKERFTPRDPQQVSLYTCGPTVYDFAHIGNFRAYIFEDLLRRYLKVKGYNVVQVMNLTDVDDKTISGAQQAGVSLHEYTKEYIEAFFNDLDLLRIERAEYYPRATEHIPEMIALVKTLIDKGHAYERDGSIYFNIRSFSSYGKLSKKKLEGNIAGVRVDHDEYEKDNASDFVLWKKAKEGEPAWESPFGLGRPGWHIECSAMSMKYLGETFDVHTGGEDNVFPHHENEIAQSEAATGKPFVHYWLHCKFLLVENEKMSKSKGNFYTLRDLLAQGHSPVAIRYLLLSHNYRHPLNFTFAGLEQAQAAIKRFNDFMTAVRNYVPASTAYSADCSLVEKTQAAFEAALDDDLNIAQGLAVLFDFITLVNKKMHATDLSRKQRQAVEAFMQRVDGVLGILDRPETVPDAIVALAEKRIEARRQKNFNEADALRDEMLQSGWLVEDTPQGPRFKKK